MRKGKKSVDLETPVDLPKDIQLMGQGVICMPVNQIYVLNYTTGPFMSVPYPVPEFLLTVVVEQKD
jgi:hypothetical protein